MGCSFPGLDNNEIRCGNNANLQITGAMTVMCWVISDVAQDISILTKFGVTRGFSLQTDLDVGPTTFGLFFIAPTSGTVFGSGFTAIPLADGTLYHLAGIFRPSTSVEVWLDGALSGSRTVGVPATQFNTANDVALGGRMDGTQNLDGTMFDARIYNRALSAGEMATIHAARGHDGIVDGRVSRWLMNEGAPGVVPAGATIVDSGGGGNTGTPAGTSPYVADPLSFRKRMA